MQSLRTRRSQRRGPPSKLTKATNQPIPRENRVKSRVDDKIKQRMSMRYAEISSPTELVPPVPTISHSLSDATHQRAPSPGISFEGENGEVAWSRSAREDRRLLEAEEFDPDAFLKLKLANSTEAELKSLQSSLDGAKEDTAKDLQRTVFKNYAEFVLISKEISTLENELMELKDLLSEYKSMPSLLNIPDPTTISSSTLSTYRRSSVADLRIMYYNQMQTLHASIEGAAKFAPITPGRHIVSEMDGILSLNAATYKVTGKVKFVILDDAMLVARRRRRNVGNDSGGASKSGSTSSGKLVAEHCWPLNEMPVLDTKDSSRIANVFKIRHGKETHVFRTENAADKKALLVQLRQVAEELAAKKRKEREGEHERRKTQFHAGGGGGDRNVPPMPEWIADFAKRTGDMPGVGIDAKEKTERDSRWTSDWADQLTIAIALHEWTKAVELVENAQERVAVTPPLESKLPVLRSQLIAALVEALSKPTMRKTAVVNLISLLTRLNAGSAARNTLFRMRSQVIKGHIRNIRFEGNICSYIGDLAMVCFTGIKHSADWFLASFKENEVASSFINWAKKEIEDYANIFRKQVFTPDVDPTVAQEAIKVTHAQSKKLLQEYGLDFTYLLNELLVAKPKDLPNSESTFSFNAHNRLSKNLFLSPNTTTPATTPKQASVGGRRTPPIQGITSPPATDTPPVPALPSYLRQPSRPSSRSSVSTSESDHPSPHSKIFDASRTSTSTSASVPSVPSPADTSNEFFVLPVLTSPTSPPTMFPSSAGSTSMNHSFATLGSVYSPPSANGRAVFSIPLRSGARTPVSAKGGPPAYATPTTSPAPQSAGLSGLLGSRTPQRVPSSNSLNGTVIDAGGAKEFGMGDYARTSMDTNANRLGVDGLNGAPGRMTPPPRPLRPGASGSPAPAMPSRSNNRPGSRTAHRPPPVAVPQHDGMI